MDIGCYNMSLSRWIFDASEGMDLGTNTRILKARSPVCHFRRIIMRHIARLRFGLACAFALIPALMLQSTAQACLFSNVASAYADGIAARSVTAAPITPQQKALWAPFAFKHAVAPGHLLHLRENMREVAKSMGAEALHWTVHWLFGDGAQASGVAVTHAYRHPGVYRIAVQANFVGPSGVKGWYSFDLVDVVVGPVPRAMNWLLASAPTRRAS
jgi:PKD domain